MDDQDNTELHREKIAFEDHYNRCCATSSASATRLAPGTANIGYHADGHHSGLDAGDMNAHHPADDGHEDQDYPGLEGGQNMVPFLVARKVTSSHSVLRPYMKLLVLLHRSYTNNKYGEYTCAPLLYNIGGVLHDDFMHKTS